MNRCLSLLLITFSLSTQADYLDTLFVQQSDISKVLPAINADGKRAIGELYTLQLRAIKHYRTARAYNAILREGLHHKDEDYKRGTCDLLLATVDDYLHYDPAPSLADVLKLIKSNGSFTVEELIALMRKALNVFPSPSDYEAILASGLKSKDKEYRRATHDLLLETFQDYLQRWPTIDEAVNLVQPNGILTAEELVDTQKKLYAAYPEIINIRQIARAGLRSEHSDFRRNTFELAIDQFINATNKGQLGSDWIDSVIELRRTCTNRGLNEEFFSGAIGAFASLLDSETTDEELVAMIVPRRQKLNLSDLILFMGMIVQARPQSIPVVLATCEALPPEAAQVCTILFGENEADAPTNIIYKKLARLRTNDFTSNKVYNDLQKQINVAVTQRLLRETDAHFHEEDTTPSRADEPGEKKVRLKKITECPVCCAERAREEMMVYQHCQHTICKDCFREYVDVQMRENAASIACTDRYCDKSLSSQDLAAIGDPHIEHALATNRLKEQLYQIKDAFYCPNEHCPDAYIPTVEEAHDTGEKKRSWGIFSFCSKRKSESTVRSNFTCQTCEYTFCTVCMKSHDGMTCKQHARTLEKTQKSEKRVMSGKNRYFKPCPRCKVMIEKQLGCDHMTCKNCKHEFSWGSLKDY